MFLLFPAVVWAQAKEPPEQAVAQQQEQVTRLLGQVESLQLQLTAYVVDIVRLHETVSSQSAQIADWRVRYAQLEAENVQLQEENAANQENEFGVSGITGLSAHFTMSNFSPGVDGSDDFARLGGGLTWAFHHGKLWNSSNIGGILGIWMANEGGFPSFLINAGWAWYPRRMQRSWWLESYIYLTFGYRFYVTEDEEGTRVDVDSSNATVEGAEVDVAFGEDQFEADLSLDAQINPDVNLDFAWDDYNSAVISAGIATTASVVVFSLGVQVDVAHPELSRGIFGIGGRI